MSLLVVGSVAFDAVETPFGKCEKMLGGSASHFSISASYFTDVRIVGVVGGDFEASDRSLRSACPLPPGARQMDRRAHAGRPLSASGRINPLWLCGCCPQDFACVRPSWCHTSANPRILRDCAADSRSRKGRSGLREESGG